MIWIIGMGILLWYIIGVISHIYWWTSEWDYTIDEIPLTIILGCGGPITWFAGRCIHTDNENKPPYILVKHRKH